MGKDIRAYSFRFPMKNKRIGSPKPGRMVGAQEVLRGTLNLQDIVQYFLKRFGGELPTMYVGLRWSVYTAARRSSWTSDNRLIGKLRGFSTLSKDCTFQIIITNENIHSFIVRDNSENHPAMQTTFFASSLFLKRGGKKMFYLCKIARLSSKIAVSANAVCYHERKAWLNLPPNSP